MMHLPYRLDRTANMDCTATDNKMSAMPPQKAAENSPASPNNTMARVMV